MRQFTAVVLASLLFSTLASSQEQHQTVRIPFRAARLLLIEATVAGHTGEFILDTGAEETLVDRKFLGLKKSGGNLSDGLAMSAAPADVRDFCISSHCFGKTRVRLLDFDKLSAEMGSPVCGMIGQDLLQKFDAVTIDYKNHFVELEPAEAGGKPAALLFEAPKPKTDRKVFVAGVSLLAASKTADAIETRRLLDRGGWELNPIFGRHPSPAKQAGVNAAFFAGQVLAFHFTERSRRPLVRRLGRVGLGFQIEEHIRAAACNAQIDARASARQGCGL